MALQTDPAAFSITALLADQVALVARHEGVSPGAAALLLRQMMERRQGCRQLLALLRRELDQEPDPREAAKIAAVLRETTAWADAVTAAIEGNAEDDGDGGPTAPVRAHAPFQRVRH